jgi:hypothetical protein
MPKNFASNFTCLYIIEHVVKMHNGCKISFLAKTRQMKNHHADLRLPRDSRVHCTKRRNGSSAERLFRIKRSFHENATKRTLDRSCSVRRRHSTSSRLTGLRLFGISVLLLNRRQHRVARLKSKTIEHANVQAATFMPKP